MLSLKPSLWTFDASISIFIKVSSTNAHTHTHKRKLTHLFLPLKVVDIEWICISIPWQMQSVNIFSIQKDVENLKHPKIVVVFITNSLWREFCSSQQLVVYFEDKFIKMDSPCYSRVKSKPLGTTFGPWGHAFLHTVMSASWSPITHCAVPENIKSSVLHWMLIPHFWALI